MTLRSVSQRIDFMSRDQEAIRGEMGRCAILFGLSSVKFFEVDLIAVDATGVFEAGDVVIGTSDDVGQG